MKFVVSVWNKVSWKSEWRFELGLCFCFDFVRQYLCSKPLRFKVYTCWRSDASMYTGNKKRNIPVYTPMQREFHVYRKKILHPPANIAKTFLHVYGKVACIHAGELTLPCIQENLHAEKVARHLCMYTGHPRPMFLYTCRGSCASMYMGPGTKWVHAGGVVRHLCMYTGNPRPMFSYTCRGKCASMYIGPGYNSPNLFPVYMEAPIPPHVYRRIGCRLPIYMQKRSYRVCRRAQPIYMGGSFPPHVYGIHVEKNVPVYMQNPRDDMEDRNFVSRKVL